LKVRTFSMKDYVQVRALWEASGLEIRPGDSKEEVRKKVRRDPELFLVAEERGKIVGTAMGGWDGRRGWIYHLGVLPGSQRKGVATAVVRELERRMKRKGVPKVNAVVFNWNERSKRFFEKMGYAADTVSTKYGKSLVKQDPGCV
jgi:ribosomal protein S18 acetylase RimI-like enzyme